MTNSESILNELILICEKNKEGNLFCASIEFCEEHDLDIPEFLMMIDSNIKKRIKEDCITAGMVQKKLIPASERMKSIFEIE